MPRSANYFVSERDCRLRVFLLLAGETGVKTAIFAGDLRAAIIPSMDHSRAATWTKTPTELFFVAHMEGSLESFVAGTASEYGGF